jgi:hypothetical protein
MKTAKIPASHDHAGNGIGIYGKSKNMSAL